MKHLVTPFGSKTTYKIKTIYRIISKAIPYKKIKDILSNILNPNTHKVFELVSH